jgi:hypothetical protein
LKIGIGSGRGRIEKNVSMFVSISVAYSQPKIENTIIVIEYYYRESPSSKITGPERLLIAWAWNDFEGSSLKIPKTAQN